MNGEILAFVLLSVGRLVSYVAVIAAIGIVAFRLGVLPETGLPRALPTLEDRLHRLGLASAIALLLATVGRLFAQTYSVFGIDDGVTLEFVSIVANQTRWGEGWSGQAAVAVLLLVAVLADRYASSVARPAALVAVVGAGLALPLTGHAVAHSPAAVSVAVQVAHVWGAGLWLGTLFVVVVAGIPTLRTDGVGERAAAPMVDAFSPMAMIGVGTIVASGVLSAVLYLEAPHQLWSSTYGRTLLLKIGLFLAVGACGAYNWRRARPALRRTGAAGALIRWAKVELALAFVVVMVTSVLVALPIGD
jgi:copper transport protein